jgi:hypothetical protein
MLQVTSCMLQVTGFHPPLKGAGGCFLIIINTPRAPLKGGVIGFAVRLQPVAGSLFTTQSPVPKVPQYRNS